MGQGQIATGPKRNDVNGHTSADLRKLRYTKREHQPPRSHDLVIFADVLDVVAVSPIDEDK
jgi:hypothetical protein